MRFFQTLRKEKYTIVTEKRVSEMDQEEVKLILLTFLWEEEEAVEEETSKRRLKPFYIN
jgi:hypothetical protein